MPKPTHSKPQTAQPRPGADAPPAVRPEPPVEGRDGGVLLSASAARGSGRPQPPATTRSPAPEGAGPEIAQPGASFAAARREAGGGGRGAQNAQARPGGLAGGPGEGEGGRPKCGSHTGAGGASTLAIEPRDPENIPPISGEVYPPEDPNTPTLAVEIYASFDDITTPIPEPGTTSAISQPAIPKALGRNREGKIVPHERDEAIAERIAKWVALGAEVNEIALFLGIRPGVLKKHYKRELFTGKFANDMEVGETILQAAKDGSERMMLFYAKARMGWRENDTNDSNNQGMLNIHIHT